MTGRLDNKVALVTGAARGQGRSHAVCLAQEGADIVAIDACEGIATVRYPMPTVDDLKETVALVEATGRRIVARQADVRDIAQMQQAVADGIAELGRLDVVVANAGICLSAPSWEMTERQWQDVIDINLTGVWHTVKASVPAMIAAGNGGSIMFTSSIAGMRGYTNLASYVSSKHAIVGLMRALANELAEHAIRVNTIHPTNTATAMIFNDSAYKTFAPHLDHPTRDDAMAGYASINLFPVPWVEPTDISNAVVWLSSEDSRWVTGVQLPVDAGVYVKS
jgi:SDR family mycofactocin-dependent oxidoreductase